MAKGDDKMQKGILGDINPKPETHDHIEPASPTEQRGSEANESMTGGSQRDGTDAGSRDVTEGVTGGTVIKGGGTRNFRQGTGATGGDIGNRPE